MNHPEMREDDPQTDASDPLGDVDQVHNRSDAEEMIRAAGDHLAMVDAVRRTGSVATSSATHESSSNIGRWLPTGIQIAAALLIALAAGWWVRQDTSDQTVVATGPDATPAQQQPAIDGPASRPLIQYPLHRGQSAREGAGSLETILPLTNKRSWTWTSEGLVLTPADHCVTSYDVTWQSLISALAASKECTLMMRARFQEPGASYELLTTLYFRSAPGETRMLQLRADASQAGGWHQYSVVIEADGSTRTYRDGILFRSRTNEHWPPERTDVFAQLKLLLPAGHHGDLQPGPVMTISDLHLYDSALDQQTLRAMAVAEK